ncbi:hypothetical protein JZ751_021497 [Albula glossodonta]|uniref:DDE Tnp4 domain-containing protein n=1 Tax=Albula glossodonta TaxID=121402 RepID=A0A8T2NK26_9TELE|nr:hypothetical protein JZ751_021497 [Albula glossodonta]
MDRLRSFRTQSEAARRRRWRKYRRLQTALMTELMARTCIEGATCTRSIWQREGGRGREFWTTFQDTVVLWWYATPGEYRTVAVLFGIGVSTVCGLVRQVTKAILGTLRKRLISLPIGEQLDKAVQGFEARGYPQCAGAIDGTHIPVAKPQVVNDVQIPVHLIGGPAYPLKRWIMTGFTHREQLTAEQRTFNSRLGSARTCAEVAFGRLKGRWRCLARRNDVAVRTTSDIIVACCVLHNVCELRRDHFLPEWNAQVDEQERLDVLDENDDAGSAGQASAIRDAVMTLLYM